MAIVKRLQKGSPLTHAELDNNFTELEPYKGLSQTGVIDVSKYITLYQDYTSGNPINLSLGSTRLPGASSAFRIQGNLTGSVPSNWKISGATISTLAEDINEFSLWYISDNDIRVVVRVIKADGSVDAGGGSGDTGGDDGGSAGDTENPSTPTNLQAGTITGSSVELSWDAATDNVGVVSYRVYKDGVLEKAISGTSTTVTGLSSATSYDFTVSSLDAAGNESAQSGILNVTTVNQNSITPLDMSPEYMWHEFDVANTTTDGQDSVTGTSDSLEQTPVPFENLNAVSRSVQNGQECVYLETAGLVTPIAFDASSFFQDSFTFIIDVKLSNYQPSNAAVLIKLEDGFEVVWRTSGIINVVFKGSGTTYAQTATAFPAEVMNDFVRVAVTVQSEGYIKIYVDGVAQTLNPEFNGNMSGNNMASHSGSQIMISRSAFAAENLAGYVKNFILQPVVYSPEQLNALNI